MCKKCSDIRVEDAKLRGMVPDWLLEVSYEKSGNWKNYDLTVRFNYSEGQVYFNTFFQWWGKLDTSTLHRVPQTLGKKLLIVNFSCFFSVLGSNLMKTHNLTTQQHSWI